MEKAESKEAALLALRKIRERVEPPQTPQDLQEFVEEVCQGVRIRDDAKRGLVQMFFPQVPEEKVQWYMKKHGFEWMAGEQCWESKRTVNAVYHARKAINRGVVVRKLRIMNNE